jgi:ATP-binding cassette subfamily G (WHITE) protein 2 (SNQ2)
LDVLAGRKTVGTITGTLLFDGKERDANFARIAGYVEQFDSHNPLSTVREAVYFSGRLRLPSTVSNAELDDKVDKVLDAVNIRHLSGNIIGAPGFGGVSQEVRKKVTIAVELIMEPRILFLDEVCYEAEEKRREDNRCLIIIYRLSLST